jgi:hypothetical protein
MSRGTASNPTLRATTAVAVSADAATARRLGVVLAAVAVLSAADLVFTLMFMRTTGLFEQNPLVCMLARATDSPVAIALYKALTVGVAVALLYRLRASRLAEGAAWFSLAVLVSLSIQWLRYSSAMGDLDADTWMQLTQLNPSRWVCLK